jgi:hypothetical protein
MCRLIGIHVLADGMFYRYVGNLLTVVCCGTTQLPVYIFMGTIQIHNFIQNGGFERWTIRQVIEVAILILGHCYAERGIVFKITYPDLLLLKVKSLKYLLQ